MSEPPDYQPENQHYQQQQQQQQPIQHYQQPIHYYQQPVQHYQQPTQYYQQPIEYYTYPSEYSGEYYDDFNSPQYFIPTQAAQDSNSSFNTIYPEGQNFNPSNNDGTIEQEIYNPGARVPSKHSRGGNSRFPGSRRGAAERVAPIYPEKPINSENMNEDTPDSSEVTSSGQRGGSVRGGVRPKYPENNRGRSSRFSHNHHPRYNSGHRNVFENKENFETNEPPSHYHPTNNTNRYARGKRYPPTRGYLSTRPSDDRRFEERQSLIKSLQGQNNATEHPIRDTHKSSGKEEDNSSSNHQDFPNRYPPSVADKQNYAKSSRYGKSSGRSKPAVSILQKPSNVNDDQADQRKLTINFQRDGQNDDILPDEKLDYSKESSHTGGQVKRKARQNLGRKVEEGQRGVLIEQLTDGTYECMVCCESVRRHNAVWSCSSCYHIMHLSCTKKWARSSSAVIDCQRGWRCPACQKVTEKVPNQYRCFCGKMRDPELDRRETPHSCGDVCGKKRASNCIHNCTILCHPGPCPPCSATVNKKCLCGKVTQNIKCIQSSNFQCSKECSKQLNCGKHFCTQVCHEGSCNPCGIELVHECFGKHTSRKVICGTKESFETEFSCGRTCDRLLTCGHHKCSKLCHHGVCEKCNLLPDVVTTCPCGMLELNQLDGSPRQSCTDPIATCSNICNRLLPCSTEENVHRCKLKCHEGECGECDGETSLRCRCGAFEKPFTCAEAKQFTAGNPFTCGRRCTKKRTCGRHKCNQTCCVAEEHPCDLVCGGKLKCGLHKCEEPCHRGSCPPCLQASFEELTCHCGAEVMFPPIPCGTLPPECRKLCNRVHACQHEQNHTCHSDEKCPPCTVLTQKWCYGKHEMRKNVPCYLTEISCGMPCNKLLPCGNHNCLKKCHKGECCQQEEKCTQPCKIQRKFCKHPCSVPCHIGKECPDVPCSAQVLLKCPCGRRTAKSTCGVGGDAQNIQEFQRIMIQNLGGLDLNDASSVDMSQFSGTKRASSRKLDCDEECAVAERNKRVALALEIKNPDLRSKLGNPSYSDFLKDQARQNPHFVSSVEKYLLELVQAAKQSKQNYKSHSFQPMNRNQRQTIHELCEFYGCESQSYDSEPKRNVVAIAHRDKCFLPSVTLTSFIQREKYPRAPPPIPLVHKEEDLRKSMKAANLSTEVKIQPKTKPSGQIDYFDFSQN